MPEQFRCCSHMVLNCVFGLLCSRLFVFVPAVLTCSDCIHCIVLATSIADAVFTTADTITVTHVPPDGTTWLPSSGERLTNGPRTVWTRRRDGQPR
eukprot:m.597696 g.597696  ORF g.597696 m.597696 type:complete len:96 (+) comp22417_c0_seq4:1926-2213(+)